jgi:hypothetical protein
MCHVGGESQLRVRAECGGEIQGPPGRYPSVDPVGVSHGAPHTENTLLNEVNLAVRGVCVVDHTPCEARSGYADSWLVKQSDREIGG